MTTTVIIDIAAAVVLLGFAAGGAKRGLFRALAGLLTIVVALAGAGIIAAALTTPVTDVYKRQVLGYLLHTLVAEKYGGKCTWDELGLPVTETGLALPCGATGRWFSE